MVVVGTFFLRLAATLMVVEVTERNSEPPTMIDVDVVAGAIVDPTTMIDADRYPVRETRTVTVAESPAVSPVTVASPVSPSVTDPAVDVNVYAVVDE